MIINSIQKNEFLTNIYIYFHAKCIIMEVNLHYLHKLCVCVCVCVRICFIRSTYKTKLKCVLHIRKFSKFDLGTEIFKPYNEKNKYDSI